MSIVLRSSFFLVFLLILGINPSLEASHDAIGLHLQVYPNPSSSGVFSVELSGQENLGEINIVVFNLIGKRVYQERVYFDATTYQQSIDLSHEAKGMYMLEISHKAGKQVRRLSFK